VSTPVLKPCVYVIDDDPSMRAALDDLLQSVNLEVKVFASIDEFLRTERRDSPSCLILDIRMPGMSGLEFQRVMSDLGLEMPVIFITGHGDIPMSVQAMKAGAIDFLTKPFRDQDLLDAIHVALDSDRKRRAESREIEELRNLLSRLSEGELDVLKLVATGLLNKQIAAQLHVSEITVKVRRSQLKKKLDAHSVADLARLADRMESIGLI
jgi:FixJ family two-component response regulator